MRATPERSRKLAFATLALAALQVTISFLLYDYLLGIIFGAITLVMIYSAALSYRNYT